MCLPVSVSLLLRSRTFVHHRHTFTRNCYIMMHKKINRSFVQRYTSGPHGRAVKSAVS